MTILPWLSSQYNKNMLVDLPSFVGKGISSLKFHQMSTSSIKVYQCMHSPFFYCVWMKSQGRKSKTLYFLSHQSKYCYIYYNFVHIYETLGISTSQPHHSRRLIKYYSPTVAEGKTFVLVFSRDSRWMSYEPIKKWVCPYIYPPQILMVCMYIGRKLALQTKIL